MTSRLVCWTKTLYRSHLYWESTGCVACITVAYLVENGERSRVHQMLMADIWSYRFLVEMRFSLCVKWKCAAMVSWAHIALSCLLFVIMTRCIFFPWNCLFMAVAGSSTSSATCHILVTSDHPCHSYQYALAHLTWMPWVQRGLEAHKEPPEHIVTYVIILESWMVTPGSIACSPLEYCLSVCQSVCEQHYSKSYERIVMKFYEGVQRQWRTE